MPEPNESTSDRSPGSSPEVPPPRATEHKGPMSVVVGALGGTNKKILAAGSLAVALIAIITLAKIVLPGGGGNSPVMEANFDEAKVEQNVLLEQYLFSSQTTASAGEGSRALPAGYRLVAHTASASAGPAIGVLATVSHGSTATSASASVTTSNSQAGEEEADLKEEEKVKNELQLQEAKELKEEARAKEQAELDEEKVLREEAKQREEAQRGEEMEPQGEGKAKVEKAKAEARETNAEEEATIRAKEEVTVKKEEEHPTPVALPASSTPLHREGDAKVLAGAGAPTGEVEAVLNKAGVELPSNCHASCGLRPTVEKAIVDTSSNLDEAADEVAAIFHGSRARVYDDKSQPVGVIVDYAIDFVGFAGRRMILEWTLCSRQTERPLPREWWRNVIVKQIEPSSISTKIPGSFWAPIPPARGDYYFRLRVFYDESEVAHGKTESFH
jgi:hypothetical protein